MGSPCLFYGADKSAQMEIGVPGYNQPKGIKI